MPSFTELLAQGAGHAWLFIPSAILLGALHGLEPGHSKTMMAAFIIAMFWRASASNGFDPPAIMPIMVLRTCSWLRRKASIEASR